MSAAFLNAESLETVVAYFSLINLKGAGVSILIGLLLYVLVVRKWMETVQDGNRIYRDRWPAGWIWRICCTGLSFLRSFPCYSEPVQAG